MADLLPARLVAKGRRGPSSQLFTLAWINALVPLRSTWQSRATARKSGCSEAAARPSCRDTSLSFLTASVSLGRDPSTKMCQLEDG